MKIPVEEELLSTLQATLEAVRIELANVRKMAQGNDPFSMQDAANYLKVSTKTITRYIQNKQLTPSSYGGRMWVTRNELDLFIARNRHGRLN